MYPGSLFRLQRGECKSVYRRPGECIVDLGNRVVASRGVATRRLLRRRRRLPFRVRPWNVGWTHWVYISQKRGPTGFTFHKNVVLVPTLVDPRHVVYIQSDLPYLVQVLIIDYGGAPAHAMCKTSPRTDATDRDYPLPCPPKTVRRLTPPWSSFSLRCRQRARRRRLPRR